MVNDGDPTYIYKDESGFLVFESEGLPLATKDDYEYRNHSRI